MIEADFLYAFIFNHKPLKIIQIGCGVSTSVILRACRDAGYHPELVCVDPIPMPYLVNLSDKGSIRLIKEKAQKVHIDLLTELSDNDFFFVDSTHSVKPGSEVNRIILEVLPRLQKKVWVHFHDIFFPYDYTRDILTHDMFFWSESILLQAFLTQNPNFTIKASLSMLHYAETENLKRYFLKYDPQSNEFGLRGKQGKHFPSSTYLQVV